jgi:competence protein ComEC
LIVVLGAVTTGVVVDDATCLAWWWWGGAALVALVGWLVTARRCVFWPSLALFIAACAMGGLWHHLRWNCFSADDIGRFATRVGRPVAVDVVATSQPSWSFPSESPLWGEQQSIVTRCRARAVALRDGSSWVSATGRLELRIDGQLVGVSAGDRLRVHGHLIEPAPATNPGDFDFRAYQRGQRQLCFLRVEQPQAVQTIGRARWSPALMMQRWRGRLDALVWEHVRAEHAPLASALLLGNRDQLDSTAEMKFLITGTIHILSISGLHVGVLTAGVLFLGRMKWLGRRTSLAGACAFVIAYAWLVDLRAPVVRAAVLVCVFGLARWRGRPVLSLNSLAAAALVVIALNPREVFSVGAQLSFLAVATMTVGHPLWRRRGIRDPLDQLLFETRPRWQRVARTWAWRAYQALAISTAVWLISLPLVAHKFHVVSLVAILVNPLVLPPIAVALYAGVGVLVFGGWLPWLGDALGALCDGSLGVVEILVDRAAQVPASHLWTAGPTMWAIVLLYSLLAVFLVVPRVRVAQRWVVAGAVLWLACGWIAPGSLPSWARSRPDSVRCTFIDVGHGTSVLVQLPSGQNVLYDCGSARAPQRAVRSITACLWSRRIDHLDAIVISHADADHYNALPGIMDRFSVGSIIVSSAMRSQPDHPLNVFLDECCQARGVAIRQVAAGDQLVTDPHCQMRVLLPTRRGSGESHNADSIVIAVESAGANLVLPGDLEGEGLRTLLAQAPVDCDVLMAPHHGSPHSWSRELQAWSQPEVVVVSASRSRLSTAPVGLWNAPDRTVLVTAYDGAIGCEIGGPHRVRATVSSSGR